MTIVCKPEDLHDLPDGNRFLGVLPHMHNSQIRFSGRNNLLFCAGDVRLKNCCLSFRGNNGLIFIEGDEPLLGITGLEIDVYNRCTCAIGCQPLMNPDENKLEIIVTEGRNCIIGRNCMIGRSVRIRTSDAHPVYSAETGRRVNRAKSVFIGDHVWIGEDVRISKGTQVDSGSILGSSACVAGKKIPANTSWVGNPAKQIGSGIFWNMNSDHQWTAEDDPVTGEYEKLLQSPMDITRGHYPESHRQKDSFVYRYMEGESVGYDDIDRRLMETAEAYDRYEYLKELFGNAAKNRFVHQH